MGVGGGGPTHESRTLKSRNKMRDRWKDLSLLTWLLTNLLTSTES